MVLIVVKLRGRWRKQIQTSRRFFDKIKYCALLVSELWGICQYQFRKRKTRLLTSGQNSSNALVAMRPAKPSDVRRNASPTLLSL